MIPLLTMFTMLVNDERYLIRKVPRWFTANDRTPPRLDDTPPRVHRLDPAELSQQMTLAVTRQVSDQLERSIGQHRAETGAMLGGSRQRGLISEVFLDRQAEVSSVIYLPDIPTVNQVIRKWEAQGLNFMGFAHSHPGGFARPSNGDRVYAERILRVMPTLDRMAMPIIQTVPDTGSYAIKGYVAVRGETPARLDWRGQPVEDGSTVHVLPAPLTVLDPQEMYDKPAPNPFLERVATAYDPQVMAATRLVAVGVGGSVGYLETMARCGVGQFVLIDPDTIEAKNVGTQAVDPLDIDRAKVDALAERLVRLNPNCRVWTIQAKDHDIDDTGFHRLLREPLPDGPATLPGTTLLCAFTDKFPAQDRVHRLGLHFGVPVLAAGVYRQGRGLEISFAAPGLTRSCLRCALSSRYRAYLREGYTNDVTSDGTPFLATDRLNALKQIPTLALLHSLSSTADPDHPATKRWRRAMEAITDRNLALTRLDPDFDLPSFARLAQVADGSCVMDETVWTKPTPDGPDTPDGTCPDCGGVGDLTEAIGTFTDTRVLPKSYGQDRRVKLALALAA